MADKIIDETKVISAITRTFKNRDTEIQKIEPAGVEMIGLWRAFQKKVPSAPKDLSEVINELNNYLIGILLVK